MSLGIGGQFQGKLYVLTGRRDCGAQGVRGKMRDFMGHGAALIAATLNSESHHRQRAGRRQPCVGTGA